MMRCAWIVVSVVLVGCSGDETEPVSQTPEPTTHSVEPKAQVTVPPPQATAPREAGQPPQSPSADIKNPLDAPSLADALALARPTSPADRPPSAAKPKPADADVPIAELIAITFEKPAYQFTLAEVAAGVRLKYTVRVRQNVWVTPTKQDVGHAGAPSTAGLYPFAEIVGGDQYYGARDVGRGPSPNGQRFFLKKGTYSGVVAWDGRNWQGPSDTNQPKGAPFPAGTYQAKVRIAGAADRRGAAKEPYMVEAVAEVVLAP